MRTHRPLIVAALLAVAAWPALATRSYALDVTDDVFYQFMPIAWRDSNNDTYRFGDFNGMTASLDYLATLGVTAVWMNPIFPSPAYHGYQHGPGDQLNSRFGTEAQFLNFVQQAHARGIKVFIDFVVYGISQNSIWYQNAYNNPSSPYDGWLAFTNSANTSYVGSTYNSWDGSFVGFINWNLDNPNPTSLLTTWARKWLDPDGDGDPSDGIDGYRFDSVWEQGPNGWGYDLDWWRAWRDQLRVTNPNVFLFAEQGDWGITGLELMPALDSTFTKPFEFAARDSLSSETAGSLYSQMANTLAQTPAGRTFLGTIGDHDVDRLTSVLGGSLQKAKVAAAILMISPFPPIIYYGDEIGMLGTKGDYGSDANDIPMREPFKWNAVAAAPMSNYWALNSQAYNNRFSRDNDGRSVAEQLGVTGSLLEEYRLLIAIRKAHAALRRGSYVPITNNTTRVWSFLRHLPGEETLLVAIRLRNSSAATTYDFSGMTIPGGSTTVRDVITGAYLSNITDANKAAYSITLPAYSYKILSVNLAPTPPAPNDIDGVDIPAAVGSRHLVATQNNATGLGDNISELDQLYVRPDATGLRIGITGDLAANSTGLVLFLDTVSGGQNPLTTAGYPDPSSVSAMNGLRFDAGFQPDHLLYINAYGPTVYVDQFTLPTSGSTTKTYRGNGTVNSGSGVLAGGTNPNGMQVAMNNTNVLGVTDADADAAGAAAAVNGFDLFIPYADIGVTYSPSTTIGLVAFVVRSNGQVSNQWLPGLGGGYPNLGTAPNMTSIPGRQYALVPFHVQADLDMDGDVDLDDFGRFRTCFNGPNHPPAATGCEESDFDADGDVDLADFSVFRGCFNGPNRPVACW